MSWLARIFRGDPARTPSGDPARVREVEAVLAELRPYFRADLGDIELEAVDGDYVDVRLRGACATCSASDSTLFGALEPRLKERVPWVRGVRAR
ncbi:MAG: NifU family protein [Planctomycetota bacterium]